MGLGNESFFPGSGSLIKMAATTIYGKRLKNLLLQTNFTTRSNLVSYAFIWGKLLESHLMEETYSLYKSSDPALGQYTCLKT